MEILERQLNPPKNTKRILPSATDVGLNTTFPRIRPAREKKKATVISKLKMFKKHIVDSTKSSRGLGGDRSKTRVLLAAGNRNQPIEMCARFLKLNEQESHLSSQYPYTIPSITNVKKNIISCTAHDWSGSEFPVAASDLNHHRPFYYMKKDSQFEKGNPEELEQPPFLICRFKAIFNCGLEERHVFDQSPIQRLIAYSIDGGKSMIVFSGPQALDKQELSPKYQVCFGKLMPFHQEDYRDKILASTGDKMPHDKCSNTTIGKLEGQLPRAIRYLFFEQKRVRKHTQLMLQISVVIIDSEKNPYDIFSIDKNPLEIYWKAPEKRFSVRPRIWKEVRNLDKTLRLINYIKDECEQKFSDAFVMITLRISNNAAKGMNKTTKTRRQMKGDLSFILLPGVESRLSKDFEDVVLPIRRNTKDGLPHTRVGACVVPYRNSAVGKLIQPYVDNGGASLVFVCSKLSAKLSTSTARSMAVATINIKRTMKQLRSNYDIHTPRIAEESIVMDMRKKGSKKEKQQSRNKKNSLMHRKSQKQKKDEASRKRHQLRLEREKRMRDLKEEERRRRRKEEIRKLWMPEMLSVAHQKLEDTPIVHKSTFAPILNSKVMTEPIFEADAIDMAVTLPPKIEKIEPQKVVLNDDNEKLEEEDIDIFEELERQRKENEWAAFKEKLDLTNWVEDIVLERFQS